MALLPVLACRLPLLLVVVRCCRGVFFFIHSFIHSYLIITGCLRCLHWRFGILLFIHSFLPYYYRWLSVFALAVWYPFIHSFIHSVSPVSSSQAYITAMSGPVECIHTGAVTSVNHSSPVRCIDDSACGRMTATPSGYGPPRVSIPGPPLMTVTWSERRLGFAGSMLLSGGARAVALLYLMVFIWLWLAGL